MHLPIRNTLRTHVLLVLTLCITALVYGIRLQHPHISWDDPEMVFKNRDVREFNLGGLFTKHYVGNYIPVTMLFHALMYRLFGDQDMAHNTLNLFLHLLNGLLLYRLTLLLFNQKHLGVLASVVFLLHPLQVESVAWISELKNLLSTTFYLLGLLAWIKYLKRPRLMGYWMVIFIFILGLLSKPSVLVFPLCLVCIELINQPVLEVKKQWNKLPFLMLSIFFGTLTVQSQSADLFINHAHEFPFWQRLSNSGFALLNYFILFLFPFKLSIIYPFPVMNWMTLSAGFLFLLVLALMLVACIRFKNFQLIGSLLFVLMNLILVLQFLPFGEVLYADRYAYVPLIGMAWMLGSGITSLKIDLRIPSVVLMIFLGLLTTSRLGVWKNALTLYEDILRKYPDEFLALNSAGVECMFRNEDQRALEYFNRSVKAAPNNYKSYYNRGLLYLKNQKANLAVQSFDQSIALYEYAKSYSGRAAAYLLIEDLPKAIEDAKHALDLDPKNGKAYFVLAGCYEKLNQLSEAQQALNTCIQMNPDDPDYYFKRAMVLGKMQDFKASKMDLDLCIELRSNFAEAYYWRAVSKVNLKENACDDFEKAAQLNFGPAVNAYNNYCR